MQSPNHPQYFMSSGPTTAKLDEPEVINAKEGNDVTLSCTDVGLPTPQLTWTREVGWH
jgi:hypothetical protein